MSADWIDMELGEFAELKRGYDLPKREREIGIIPLVSSSGTTDLHSVAKVKGPGVITGRYGTIGQVFYVEEDFWPLNTTLYVQNFKNNNPLFVYYLLKTISYEDYSDKAAVPGINRNHLHKAKVRVPVNPSHQQEIAEKLWVLDSKIELNRQINQTLEQIAQAIFKSWFVDFEPTHAKIIAKAQSADPATQELAAQAIICGAITLEQLQGYAEESVEESAQQREQESLSTRLQKAINEKLSQASANPLNATTAEQLIATAALFPNELVESELGEVPEGWEWSEIGNEVTVVGGGTPSTKNEAFWEGGHINWTTPKDMSGLNDKILIETNRKITTAGLAKISSGLLPVNTVLMSSRAPVGYLAIAKVSLAVNQGYIAMKCEKALTPEYVVQWANSSMDDIKQRASGTTFAEISKSNFRIIPVLVPTLEVISQFSRTVSMIYEMITENIKESKSSEEIRDYLLPKLLSGELTLEAAE